MLIWLLASRTDNKLPYDGEWVSRKIEAKTPVNLDELQAFGFIEIIEGASTTLATRFQSARPEREREGEERQSKDRERARRWTLDDAVQDAWQIWARDKLGMPMHEVIRQSGMFADHWLAASGRTAAKKDWFATWRNWCRRAPDFAPRGNGRGPPEPTRPTEAREPTQFENDYDQLYAEAARLGINCAGMSHRDVADAVRAAQDVT